MTVPQPDGQHAPDEPTDLAKAPSDVRRRPSRRSSMLRLAFYALSAALLAWAAVTIPLPFVEYFPGQPTSIAPLVEIDGIETTELNGDTALLTVLLRPRATASAIGALIDPRRSLIPAERVYVLGPDRETHLAAERERFNRQFDIAAAVGATAAGIEGELITEVVVLHVAPGSPAEGHLFPGDVVLEADGQPLVAAEELQAMTVAAEPGDLLNLTVQDDDGVRQVDVELDVFGDGDQVRLGVVIQTAVEDILLPFEVSLADDTRIGGPSAGMMVAITIYDLLSDEDLLRGRTVMGTGTIDADGRVGAIGGVPEKMRAAADAGADLVLVPERQLELAVGAAPDGLDVVGVEDFDDALTALRAS